MSTNQYQDQLQKWMKEWKNKLEEMQDQISSGQSDAAEMFEKQKEHMRSVLHSMKENMDTAVELSATQIKEMKAKAEQLQVQLSLGKAEGYDMFQEQKKKIEEAFEEFSKAASEAYHKGFDKGMAIFDYNAKAFRMSLEIFQLQFNLAKMDAKDDAAKMKKELNERLGGMQQLFGEGQKLFLEQVEDWNKLWQKGFERMRDWGK